MALTDVGERTGERSYGAPPPQIIDPAKKYIATIATAKGDIVVDLDNKRALTTNNFVYLAAKGYYDGLIFHRVEPGFVIQGGCPQGTGTGGPGYQIPGDFKGSSFSKGVIGMARSSHPDSAGSQFYIMIGDAHSLDDQYADFGRVVSGQDVADRIAVGDRIDSITIEER
jgi:cyclophilin family peptidyl-prolyl cis-trans isomerase